jgi:hypothetical protein
MYCKGLGQYRVRIVKEIRIGKKRKLELVQVEFDEVVVLSSLKTGGRFHDHGFNMERSLLKIKILLRWPNRDWTK